MKPLNFRNSWSSIRMAEDESQPAQLELSGPIGGGWFGDEGVQYDDFVQALDAIPADRQIVMNVNSEGGSIYIALGLFSRLLERRANLTAKIHGMALSAASWLPAAAKEVQTSKHARWFLHGAQALVIGGADAMREVADQLDVETDNIADLLSEYRGRSKQDWLDLMANDTWLGGQAAIDAGLADGLIVSSASPSNRFPTNRLRRLFVNVPDSLPPGGIIRGRNSLPANTVNTMTPANATPAAPAAPAATATPEPVNTPTPAAAATPAPVNATPAPALDIAAVLAAVNAQTAAVNSLVTSLRPAGLPGTEPLGRSGVQNVGNPLIEQYRAMKPGSARNEFRVQNHAELLRVQTQFAPANANTIAAALCTDTLSDSVVTVLSEKLAALSAFTTDFTLDRLKPLSSVQVRKFTTGSAVQKGNKTTSITNYESGDSTLAAVPVVIEEVSKSWMVDNREMMTGTRLAHLAQGSTNIFANAISDAWTKLLIAANFDAPIAIGAAADFAAAKLAPILAAAKNYPASKLLLDGAHAAYLAPANTFGFTLGSAGAFGFDSITPQNRWTAAVANTVGFISGGTAIAAASGLPLALPAEEYLALETITIPGLNLGVQTATWYSRQSRSWWQSLDVLIGFAVLDGSAGEVLVTA